jgi:hypothetical protein
MNDNIFEGSTTFAPLPGDRLPQYMSLVTAEMISDIRRAMGIDNQGVCGLSIASRSSGRETSARRMLALGLVTRALNNWCNGRFDQEGRIEATYAASVEPGDVLVFDGIVESIEKQQGSSWAHARFRATVDDREIMSGWCHQPLDPFKS